MNTTTNIPNPADQNFVALCLDFGDGEPVFAELPFGMTRKELLKELCEGQHEQAALVFEYNPAEGWASDISEDIAREWMAHILLHDFDGEIKNGGDLPAFIVAHMTDTDLIVAQAICEAKHDAAHNRSTSRPDSCPDWRK